MDNYYVLTGYNKKTDSMMTRCYKSLDKILSIINDARQYHSLKLFDNPKSFDAQVKASSHGGNSFIIDTDPEIVWAVHYVSTSIFIN